MIDFDLEAPGLERYFAEVLPPENNLLIVQQHAPTEWLQESGCNRA